jgi:hypothetical protein
VTLKYNTIASTTSTTVSTDEFIGIDKMVYSSPYNYGITSNTVMPPHIAVSINITKSHGLTLCLTSEDAKSKNMLIEAGFPLQPTYTELVALLKDDEALEKIKKSLKLAAFG